jgi:hypothetical protein
MIKQRIEILQGDSDTFLETISNLSSLSGYTCKMYIKKKDGTAIGTLTGTPAALVISYPLLNEASKVYPLGEHKFETKLFDASDHVYTPSKGIFEVKETDNNDPS